MPRTNLSIDEPSYDEGYAAFAAGASVRSIIEQVKESVIAGTFDEDKTMSSAIGFIDALLDHIRNSNKAKS
jgi:hypothetical protein